MFRLRPSTNAFTPKFPGHHGFSDRLLAKDEEQFPDFDDQLLSDMRTSLDLQIDDVVWSETSDYRKLLLSNETYANRDLATVYGLDDEAFKEVDRDYRFIKVNAPENQRSGVLTHPYLLSTFAYHNTTSPIHRGVFLTRSILRRSLNPPPMAIEFEDSRFDPHLTMREKVAEMTAPLNCQSCHRIINPLGFSLENYDAIGRYRTEDKGKPVDVSGIYPALEGKTITLNGIRDLGEYAARNPAAQQGFIEQLFHHMIHQPIAAYGEQRMEQLHNSFVENEFNIQKLMIDIAVTAASKPEGNQQQIAKGNKPE